MRKNPNIDNLISGLNDTMSKNSILESEKESFKTETTVEDLMYEIRQLRHDLNEMKKSATIIQETSTNGNGTEMYIKIGKTLFKGNMIPVKQ